MTIIYQGVIWYTAIGSLVTLLWSYIAQLTDMVPRQPKEIRLQMSIMLYVSLVLRWPLMAIAMILDMLFPRYKDD